ncbi:MAG: hypothetical protein AAF770_01740 [Bacteroidota bacterium]
MLKKIVIINSEIYAKADIQLDQAESIQLIAENNVGKSSLINTLNFLYIIDQRHMQFEGDRRLQDSLQHYFPSVQRSFIIFELSGASDFCILVRRTPDNQLEYYHIPEPYQASWFFTVKRKGEEVISFTQLLHNMEQAGIAMKKLDHAQLYHKVYSQEASENPIVLLSSHATRRGRSYHNHFTQIYKHLIRSSRISATDLTEALLVSFNKAETELTIFSDRNHDSLQKLFNLHKKIDRLKKVASPFLALKEVHAKFETIQNILGKLYFSFKQHYPAAIKRISDLQEEVTSKIEQAQKKHLTITQAIRLTNQAIGATQREKTMLQEEQQKKLATLQQLASYDTPLGKTDIKEKMQQKLKEKQALEQIINRIASSAHASSDLDILIKRLERKQEAKKAQIKSCGNPLIHHIAQDPAIRSRLNAILSPDLLYAPKSLVKKPISKIEQEMTLFDGIIDIKDIQPKQDFTTVEEMKAELAQVEDDLAAAKKIKEDKKALEKLEQEYAKQQQLWMLLQQKPQLMQEEEALQAAIQKTSQAIAVSQKKAQEQEALQQLHLQAITQYKSKQLQYKGDLERYQSWRRELDRMELPLVEEQVSLSSLEEIYTEVTTYYSQREESAKKQQTLFEEVSRQLEKYDDNISSFVKDTEKELASLDKLEDSKTELVKGVLNNFVYPTQTFLADYYEFKKHIDRFSSDLSEHQISGIHKIELHLNELKTTIEELEDIGKITTEGTFDFNQREDAGIVTLQRYIAQKASFHLKDLFRLQLRMTLQENGRSIYIDTNKQIQSYGTDKVLRLIIFLQILQILIVPEDARRIVIYVDEVGTLGSDNIQKLLSFCRTAHVLPIFASTKFIDGFHKYYTLIPTHANEGKVWVDERHAISAIAQ